MVFSDRDAGKVLVMSEKEEPEIYSQLNSVLRAKAGDRVILQPYCDTLPAYAFEFTVKEIGRRELKLEFIAAGENNNELTAHLRLALCVPNRPDKLDFIVQKAVELGAAEIILVEGEFSQFKHQLKPERLQRIILEAAEQSERALVPQISIGGKLKEYLREIKADETENFYVALERENSKRLMDMLPELRTKKQVSLLVGPEGGFSGDEIKTIKALGLKNFSLGKRILRMETAAILSLGMIGAAVE